jgi:hypothetical protein
MKINNYLHKIILFFLLVSNTIVGQIERQDIRIKPKKADEFLVDFGFNDIIGGLNGTNNGGEDIADFSFNWGNSFNTAVNNEILLRKAYEKRKRDWFNKQKNLIKENIESKLGNNFNNYNEARDALFLFSEQENIRINSITPKNKYGNLRSQGFAIQNNHLRDLKFLQLRKLEINANNINNSAYKYIKVDGIALKDIKTLNNLISKWNSLYDDFGENYGTTYYYKNVYKTLQQINSESGLKDLVISLKNNYYNSFDEWEQVNLMQFLLNFEEIKKYSRPPYPYNPLLGKFKDIDRATSPVIEEYAQQNSGMRSDLFTKSCTIRIRAGRHYITKVIPECRKAQTDALNDLLNNINVDDLILENAQNELDELTKNIPWKASTGTIANSKYTHTHFDGSRGYYQLEDGSIIVNSSSEQALTKAGDLRDKYNSFNPNDKYYYIKLAGSNKWAEMLFNPDNLADGLANLFKLGAIDLGKNLGRYVLPIEDVLVLINGKDFDGQDVSRWQAAGFILLTVVPGSKALKPVARIATNATKWTKVISKGGKSYRYTSKIVNGIVEFGTYNSTKFRQILDIANDATRQAHHVLSRNLKTHDAIQKAAKSKTNPFHIDEVLNGVPVKNWRNQFNHNAYDIRVRNLLNDIPSNLSPEETFERLKIIITNLKDVIKNNPNVHLNDLIF